jgi:hypothetical protein
MGHPPVHFLFHDNRMGRRSLFISSGLAVTHIEPPPVPGLI